MCKPVQSKCREALTSFYLYFSLILINVLSRLLPRLVDDGEAPAKKTKKDKKKKKKEEEVRQSDDDEMDTSAAVRMRPFHAILVGGKGSNMVIILLSNAFMCNCYCQFIKLYKVV